MKRAALLVVGLFLSAGVAVGQPVDATGFGPTASSAIANAAVNGVRDVAGSRITVDQSLSTDTLGDVPDEAFVEKILEVSRGTVKRLKVVSVDKVGDLFQAKVQVEVDPGKLETKSSGKGGFVLRPGELAGGTAKARLRANGAEQLQAAFGAYTSAGARTLEVMDAAVESNDNILQGLRSEGGLTEGMVPLRLTVRIGTDPTVLSELRTTLKSGADEVEMTRDLERTGSGGLWGDYRCDKNPVANGMRRAVVIFAPPKDEKTAFGLVACDSIVQNYQSNATGIPGNVFIFDGPASTTVMDKTSKFTIDLIDESGKRTTEVVELDSRDKLPFVQGSVFVGFANLANDRFGREMFSWRFSPSALAATDYGQDTKGWILLSEATFSFTLAVPVDVAETLSSVEVSVSQL